MAPTLSPDEVRSAMQTSSVDIGSSGYDTQTGWGRINAFNAVSMYSAQPDAQVDVNNFEIEASSNQMVFEIINLSNGIDGEDDLEFSILESSYKWGDSNGNIFEAIMAVSKSQSLGQITEKLFQLGGEYRRNM